MQGTVEKAAKVLAEVMSLTKQGIININISNGSLLIDDDQVKIDDIPGELIEEYCPDNQYYKWRYTKNYHGASFFTLQLKRRPDMYGRPAINERGLQNAS